MSTCLSECYMRQEESLSVRKLLGETQYANNVLTQGCHVRMTNLRCDCPPQAKARVDNHLEGWSYWHVT